MFFKWLKYLGSNEDALQTAEREVLSYINTAHRGLNVPVTIRHSSSNKNHKGVTKMDGSDHDNIWTMVFNENAEGVPIVLVHGFLLGWGSWAANIDSLARNHPVYAFDILGFGPSSRSDKLCPSDWVDTLEQWRLYLQIDKMVLVGFSVASYIGAQYAIKYPNGLAHLILADPWGFAPIPDPIPQIVQYRTPFWVKYISLTANYFNVWWMHIRLPGPRIGIEILSRSMYADFIGKFNVLGVGGVDAFRKYMLHCNAGLPMGEAAYREIMTSIVYAKEPLHEKLHLIRKDIGITYVYGENSFMPHLDLGDIFNARGFDDDDCIKVYEFPNSGHDVFLDRRVQFNNLVNEIAAKVSNYNI